MREIKLLLQLHGAEIGAPNLHCPNPVCATGLFPRGAQSLPFTTVPDTGTEGQWFRLQHGGLVA